MQNKAMDGCSSHFVISRGVTWNDLLTNPCHMQMQGEDLDVMVAAYLAFREFDERRDMLMFGDPQFNQDVTG